MRNGLIIRQNKQPFAVIIEPAHGVNIFGNFLKKIAESHFFALRRKLRKNVERLVKNVVLQHNNFVHSLKRLTAKAFRRKEKVRPLFQTPDSYKGWVSKY